MRDSTLILQVSMLYRHLSYLAITLFLSSVTLSSFAAELNIRVFPIAGGAISASLLPPCQINQATECKAVLEDAFSLIQDTYWQQFVSGRFSKVRLVLSPGNYRLVKPLALRWGFGETKGVQLEIAGESQAAIISGAALIDKWAPAAPTNLPARVPVKVRSKLWVADVAAFNLPIDVIPHSRGYGLPIKPVLTELFLGNVAQPLAGWPNIGYGRLLRPVHVSTDDKRSFAVEGRDVKVWADEPDLQMLGFWRWDWAAQSYLVSGKELATNSLTLLGTGSPYGIKPGQRIRVENALAEIDSPGEWYLNRSSAQLYFYPPAGFQGGGSELSVASGLLKIEASEKVLVRDLVFEKSRGDAVTVNNGHEVIFDHVVIRLTGNRGLVIENSYGSGIRNSLIEDTGEGGVFLSGGDRQALVPAGNFVETNVIRRYSRHVKTYRFAAHLLGVGQRVVGNTISDAPHTAIFFKGNDHLIANNEIFDVVRETSDSGAIYVGRDFTERGTVIEDNFFHDIKPGLAGQEVKGVYLDDSASGMTIRNNIFARVQQPVFIGGGRDILVENNLFFYSPPAVTIDARGLGTEQKSTLDPNGTLQKGLDAVPYRVGIYASRYPHLAEIREDDFGAPKYNVFLNNLIVGGEMARVKQGAQAGIEIKGNKVVNDSIFEKNMAPNLRIKRDEFKRLPSY
ncbi:MAG: right-handed parallel beta-helix repeat-containing protein [Azonexus sp.]|nr:right-handed parallel beta-helix repeat-containing protein [Azonexus sp.]